mmetsp:Transcript_6855/g.11837  ORF Transcript_6855/g.11837 Transcript_6855/m.11837 type:complete len:301 (-) Transcript_6855:267-1169(-)
MELVGKDVEACGLVGRPDLNGQSGTVLNFDQDTGRCAVRFRDSSVQPAKIKPSNLRLREAATPPALSFQEALKENHRLSKSASSCNPIAIEPDSELFNCLSEQKNVALLVAGEFRKSNAEKAFLATVNVRSCVAMFVWAPAQNGIKLLPPVGVGCHVGSDQGMNQAFRGTGFGKLSETLNNAFKGRPAKTIQAHLIGGYKSEHVQAKNMMKKIFIDVLSEALGEGVNVDTSMLFAFEGGLTPDVQARQRFSLAALNIESGIIVTHTKHPGVSCPGFSWMIPEEYRALNRQHLGEAARGDK